jgi:hypothetical protein
MPAAINVLEVGVLAALAEPERLVQADFDGVEPGVSRGFVGEEEDDVDFFEGAESGFGVKEVDEGDDGEVCGGEDDPGAVADVAEGDGRDEDDAGGC